MAKGTPKRDGSGKGRRARPRPRTAVVERRGGLRVYTFSETRNSDAMPETTPEEIKKWLPKKWKNVKWQAKNQAYCCVLPDGCGELSGKEVVEVSVVKEMLFEIAATNKRIAKLERRSVALFPTQADLDWLAGAIQRHTGGIEAWWRENAQRLSFHDMAKIIIGVWEAGRVKGDYDAKTDD